MQRLGEVEPPSDVHRCSDVAGIRVLMLVMFSDEGRPGKRRSIVDYQHYSSSDAEGNPADDTREAAALNHMGAFGSLS
jgi:hypothetical protein